LLSEEARGPNSLRLKANLLKNNTISGDLHSFVVYNFKRRKHTFVVELATDYQIMKDLLDPKVRK